MSNSDDRLRKLEARLAYLEDLEDVRKTIARYCSAVDNKDIGALSPLFAREAEFRVEPWGMGASGHAGVIAFYERAFLDSGPTRHYLTNEVIERHGEGYRSVCYFQNSVDAAPQSLRGWGIYEDLLIREDDAWKILRKHVTVQVLGPFDEGWSGSSVTDIHAGMRDH